MKNLDFKKIKADYELNGVTVIRDIIDKKWIYSMQKLFYITKYLWFSIN